MGFCNVYEWKETNYINLNRKKYSKYIPVKYLAVGTGRQCVIFLQCVLYW